MTEMLKDASIDRVVIRLETRGFKVIRKSIVLDVIIGNAPDNLTIERLERVNGVESAEESRDDYPVKISN